MKEPAVPKAGQTRAQQLMGDVAPKLAELTDSVLFGDIWERPGTCEAGPQPRHYQRPDRHEPHGSIALASCALARQNGVTETEIVEAITHLAFYAGWPNAVSAVAVAREVFAQK